MEDSSTENVIDNFFVKYIQKWICDYKKICSLFIVIHSTIFIVYYN